MVKLWNQIKETFTKKTAGISWKIKKPHFSKLWVDITADKIFAKTTKKISGLVTITSTEDTKIKSVHYEIIEDIDPIIWKRKEEAEILGSSKVAKWFSLKEGEEKELKFSIPIAFANETKRERIWGDMELLNHMSERSKKTAINYSLNISIVYILSKNPDKKTKVVKHDVRFE